MANNSSIVSQLNKNLNGIHSVKEMIARIHKCMWGNLFEWVNVTTCKHSYIAQVDKWTCDHGDGWITECWLQECNKCGKRIITGDFKYLNKSQQDWLVLWKNYESEGI